MADLGNTSVLSPVDASNGSGTHPSWLGSAAPSTIDDAGRALQGAVAREWENRSYPTSTGTAPAFVVTYTVAPAALRSGQTYTFTAHAAAVGTDTLNANTLGAKGIKKVVAGVKTATAANDFYTGDKISCVYDGTDMVWDNRGSSEVAASTTVSGISELATTTEVLTGTDTVRAVTPNALAALWEKGSNIASAGTISVGEGGLFHVTGTTGITDIDFATATDGRCAVLIFDGILIITHSATLPLQGSANITTAAGDILVVWQDSGDTVKTVFHRADGTALVVAAANTVTVIRKTADQATTSTTLANDSHFTFSMLANTNYLIRGRYHVTNSGTGGFKLNHSGPTSPTSILFTTSAEIPASTDALYAVQTGVSTSTTYATNLTFTNGSGNNGFIDFEIVFINGANAGTWVMQLAQNSANGTTTAKLNSCMTYQVI